MCWKDVSQKLASSKSVEHKIFKVKHLNLGKHTPQLRVETIEENAIYDDSRHSSKNHDVSMAQIITKNSIVPTSQRENWMWQIMFLLQAFDAYDLHLHS